MIYQWTTNCPTCQINVKLLLTRIFIYDAIRILLITMFKFDICAIAIKLTGFWRELDLISLKPSTDMESQYCHSHWKIGAWVSVSTHLDWQFVNSYKLSWKLLNCSKQLLTYLACKVKHIFLFKSNNNNNCFYILKASILQHVNRIKNMQ